MEVESREEETATLLLTELGLLENLMYRNKSQHGRAKYFHKLEEVRRGVRELDLKELLSVLGSVRQQLVRVHSRRTPDGLSVLSGQCRSLGAAIRQMCYTCECCVSCSRFLAHEVSQRFFLNLFVVWLACLARLHALTRHVGILSYKLYQAAQSELPEGMKDAAATMEVDASVRDCLVAAGNEPVDPGTMTSVEGVDDVGEALGQSLPNEEVPSTAPSVAAGARKAKDEDDGRPPKAVEAAAKPKAMLAGDYSASEDEDEGEEAGVGKAREEERDEGPILPFFIDRGDSMEQEEEGEEERTEADAARQSVVAVEEVKEETAGSSLMTAEQGASAKKKKKKKKKKKAAPPPPSSSEQKTQQKTAQQGGVAGTAMTIESSGKLTSPLKAPSFKKNAAKAGVGENMSTDSGGLAVGVTTKVDSLSPAPPSSQSMKKKMKRKAHDLDDIDKIFKSATGRKKKP